jgi:hypothetical protein
MLDYVINALLAGLPIAFAAVLLWWLALRFLDLISKVGPGSFRRDGILSLLQRDARAAAVYYGLRCIAAAIVVGLVLSAVRF